MDIMVKGENGHETFERVSKVRVSNKMNVGLMERVTI